MTGETFVLIVSCIIVWFIAALYIIYRVDNHDL
jgi:hypothetical protein